MSGRTWMDDVRVYNNGKGTRIEFPFDGHIHILPIQEATRFRNRLNYALQKAIEFEYQKEANPEDVLTEMLRECRALLEKITKATGVIFGDDTEGGR